MEGTGLRTQGSCPGPHSRVSVTQHTQRQGAGSPQKTEDPEPHGTRLWARGDRSQHGASRRHRTCSPACWPCPPTPAAHEERPGPRPQPPPPGAAAERQEPGPGGPRRPRGFRPSRPLAPAAHRRGPPTRSPRSGPPRPPPEPPEACPSPLLLCLKTRPLPARPTRPRSPPRPSCPCPGLPKQDTHASRHKVEGGWGWGCEGGPTSLTQGGRGGAGPCLDGGTWPASTQPLGKGLPSAVKTEPGHRCATPSRHLSAHCRDQHGPHSHQAELVSGTGPTEVWRPSGLTRGPRGWEPCPDTTLRIPLSLGGCEAQGPAAPPPGPAAPQTSSAWWGWTHHGHRAPGPPPVSQSSRPPTAPGSASRQPQRLPLSRPGSLRLRAVAHAPQVSSAPLPGSPPPGLLPHIPGARPSSLQAPGPRDPRSWRAGVRGAPALTSQDTGGSSGPHLPGHRAVPAPCCLAPGANGHTGLCWGRGDKGRLTTGARD